MTFEEIFPNWKIALRNALAVGGIVLASSSIAQYPPKFSVVYSAIIGAILAVIVEFCNTYKQKNVNGNKNNTIKSFFLS